MDLLENKCEQCLYFEGDFSTGVCNCNCNNGSLDDETSEYYLGSPDWEEECEGFSPLEGYALHHEE